MSVSTKRVPEGRSLISTKELWRRIPFNRVTVWRKARDPADDFPQPVTLSKNRIGWWEHEIDAWLASRERRTYRSDPNTASLNGSA